MNAIVVPTQMSHHVFCPVWADPEGTWHLAVLGSVIEGYSPAPAPHEIEAAAIWMSRTAPGLYAEWKRKMPGALSL